MSLSDFLSTIIIISWLGGTFAGAICACMVCYKWCWGPKKEDKRQ